MKFPLWAAPRRTFADSSVTLAQRLCVGPPMASGRRLLLLTAQANRGALQHQLQFAKQVGGRRPHGLVPQLAHQLGGRPPHGEVAVSSSVRWESPT